MCLHKTYLSMKTLHSLWISLGLLYLMLFADLLEKPRNQGTRKFLQKTATR